MDLEYAYKRLIAALHGVAAGKGILDVVEVPSYGQQAHISFALADAGSLEETFHADHLSVVDEAFSKLGRTRPSNRIDVCAEALQEALQRQAKVT
jgi:hypothetical protein